MRGAKLSVLCQIPSSSCNSAVTILYCQFSATCCKPSTFILHWCHKCHRRRPSYAFSVAKIKWNIIFSLKPRNIQVFTRLLFAILNYTKIFTLRKFLTFRWPCCISVYLSQYLTNLMHKIYFTISFISCLYMFRARVLIIRRSKFAFHRDCVIQFWPPDDEHMVLETCRGMK